MSKYKKTIVKPAVYKVNTPSGKEVRPVTADFLREVCKNTNEMLAAGIKIPAPYIHKTSDGIYPGPLTEKDGEEVDAATLQPKNWSSDINSGFWEDFTFSGDGIEAVLDSPNDNIGKTIQDTSIYTTPEFEDGFGRKWKNVIRHVALVTTPVEPNQENFIKISEDENALAMSFCMADEVTGANTQQGNIPAIVRLIKQKIGIDLPGDTTEFNFLDRLLTILTSLPEEEGEEDLTGKPLGAQVQSSPVIMSNENENLEKIEALEARANKLLAAHLDQVKKVFTERIKNLIQKGKIGKDYAEKQLFPAVEGLVMSLDDMSETGEFAKTPLEMSLDMLDSTPGLLDPPEDITPAGDVQEIDDMEPTLEEMTEEEANKVYDRITNYSL